MRLMLAAGFIGGVWLGTAGVRGQEMLFDFSQGTHGWVAAHAVENLRTTPEGLAFDCVGDDPYIWSGPIPSWPRDSRVLLTIRMRSEADPAGEVFYGNRFRAGQSARFTVRNDGQWHEYDVLLPPQKAGSRLRIDPAAGTGPIVIGWIRATAVRPLMATAPAPPRRAEPREDAVSVRAGDLVLAHDGARWDGYHLWVDGVEMAQSHAGSQLGVLLDGEPAYLELGGAASEWTWDDAGALHVTAQLEDAEGTKWKLHRTITPRGDGTIALHTVIQVDRDRNVFHLPLLTLLPGFGTFGEEKTQAVLPGVEYLENEPSSSEADVRGPQANRRVVDDCKLCFPMMSLVAHGRYIGCLWDRGDSLAAVFDSTDRVFDSGSHLMGLWLPGVGEHRLENELGAHRPFTLPARVPLTSTITLIGGLGESVTPAVKRTVELRGGLPPVPEFEGGFDGAVRLLAHGWLDSESHHDGLWRHAVWGTSFPPAPAADAPGYMLWLAEHTEDAELADRLRAGAAHGLERLSPAGQWESRVSHVARPFAPLVFGQIEPYAQRRRTEARQALRAVRPGRPDPLPTSPQRPRLRRHPLGRPRQRTRRCAVGADPRGGRIYR